MADNVPITPGSGYSIGMKDVSSVHFQRYLQQKSAACPDDLVEGQAAMANSMPVVIASDQSAVAVRTKDDVLELTLSIDTAVYATGDVLADTQEIANFFPISAKGVTIQSITVLDEAALGGAMDIVFLKTNVSLGTENLAVSISDADAREILGTVSVVAGDYIDLVNSKHATICPIGLPVKTAGTSIWVGVISRDAKDYVASTDLSLKIGIL